MIGLAVLPPQCLSFAMSLFAIATFANFDLGSDRRGAKFKQTTEMASGLDESC